MLKIKIYEQRISNKYSVRKLAQLSGIPKSTINDLENGKTTPDLKQLEKIAIALNVRINDLFDSPYK